MSLRLKIVLGVLLLISGFLFIRLGLYFKKSVQTASRPSPQVLSAEDENPFFIDSDQDGITDYDEPYYRTNPLNPDTDGDGYLDGEEVASGFSPSVADKNRKNTKSSNVTDIMAQRLVAGVYAGDLNPRNGTGKEFENSVGYLALATIDEATQALNPEIDENSIVLSDDSKKSQEEYLKNVASLLEGPFLSAFLSQPQTLNKAANYMLSEQYNETTKIFSDSSRTFTTAYTKLLTVSVPPKWLDFHKHSLALFRKISINYASLTKISEDPVLALTSLSDLANNLSETEFSLLQELKTLIQQGNLELPDSPLFKTLDLLKDS